LHSRFTENTTNGNLLDPPSAGQAPRPLSTSLASAHRLELIRDSLDHCGDAGKKGVDESLVARAPVLRAGRNAEELRARDGCLPELSPWPEVQDSRGFQDLPRLGVLDGRLAAEG